MEISPNWRLSYLSISINFKENLKQYTAYVEGTGELRTRRLASENGYTIEYEDETEIRRFKIESGKIVMISWGGSAVSTLQNSRSTAILGTEFE